uniref:SCP domain-containing protein n=1 Tax=Cannabis sativa TaxID=3483 RepID=A0A803NRP8_CANSA
MVMMTLMIASASSNDFLDTHNAIRAEVGVGPMTWNNTLVAYASNYANKMKGKNCELEHSQGIYGENLAAGYGEMTGEQAVKFWATEKTMYDYTSNTCTEEDACGHYLQL